MTHTSEHELGQRDDQEPTQSEEQLFKPESVPHARLSGRTPHRGQDKLACIAPM
jgi:hypothetical protein